MNTWLNHLTFSDMIKEMVASFPASGDSMGQDIKFSERSNVERETKNMKPESLWKFRGNKWIAEGKIND